MIFLDIWELSFFIRFEGGLDRDSVLGLWDLKYPDLETTLKQK